MVEIEDPSTGLLHYGARYYDPTTRTFTSPDVLVPNPHSTMSYNRYAYVANNPITYSDPTGMALCETTTCENPTPPRRPNRGGGGGGTPPGGSSGGYPGSGSYVGELYMDAVVAYGNAEVMGEYNTLAALCDSNLLLSVFCGAHIRGLLGGPEYADPGPGNAYRELAFAGVEFASRMGTISSVAEMALLAITGSGGLAGTAAAAGVVTTPRATLKAAAHRAAGKVGSGSGPVYGTRVHSQFRQEILGLNRSDIFSEVSYRRGIVVKYGTKGSVRLDAVVGASRSQPSAIYDLKTGSATLTPGRIQQIRNHLPPGYEQIPILELRP